MQTLAFLWTQQSSNGKTGPIPVSTTAKQSCAPGCPLRGKGCYAEYLFLGKLWANLSTHDAGATFANGKGTVTSVDWRTLLRNIAALPAGQLWRHNQAGDLPHTEGDIDSAAMLELEQANRGKRGFTYTHHNPAQDVNAAVIERANQAGLTINLSANNLVHADQLADLSIAPVVTVLPASVHGKTEIHTPAGRRVVVCPATYQDKTSCATCGLCARQRDIIVGFPAHGSGKRAVSEIAA